LGILQVRYSEPFINIPFL